MGSNFKSAVLEEHTVKAIRQWHSEVKQKRKKNHSTTHSTHDYSSSTTMDHGNATISSSPEQASPSYNRSPSFADQLARYSINTEIVEEHQEIGQNELEQPVVTSPNIVHDIEIQVEEKPILGIR